MRAIIRFSLDNDDSTLGRSLRNQLENDGFKKSKTSTYEFEREDINSPEMSIALALRNFWEHLNANQHTARLDHFWMYVDQGDEFGSAWTNPTNRRTNPVVGNPTKRPA